MKHPIAISLLLLFSVLFINGCKECNDDQLKENKELVKEFTERLNNQEFDKLSEVMTEDFKRHSKATQGKEEVTSLNEFIELQKEFLKSASDQKVTIKKMIAEDDHVAVYAVYTGTNDGPMPPFPATGKKIELDFLSFFRIENNKIAEMWVEWDNMALLNSLSLLPPPEKDNVEEE